MGLPDIVSGSKHGTKSVNPGFGFSIRTDYSDGLVQVDDGTF
tara:strand:+ start:289 stop:414 length:126 start_codon:yes stop_codon:yes gene_type:complete